jgi:hypothetical protein
MANGDPLYNLRRKAYKSHKNQNYTEGWQFRVVVPDSDINFDLFAKDISYGATEITTSEKVIGGNVLTSPASAAPVILGITIRDNEKGDFAKWFDEQAGKIFNKNGTKNLSYTYEFTIEIYTILKNSELELRESWVVFPTLRGDRTDSIDELGAYVTYPISFTQADSLGGK